MGVLETFPRITPFLWFDRNAEEAVDFYIGVFKNWRRLEAVRNSDETHAPKSSILTVAFELDGQKFTALNGGPFFKFDEAVSFVVRCDSQHEVDYYWSKLSTGGTEGQCGWLKVKFGLSWQIVPARLPDLIKHPKAMQAMLKITNLDTRHPGARRPIVGPPFTFLKDTPRVVPLKEHISPGAAAHWILAATPLLFAFYCACGQHTLMGK